MGTGTNERSGNKISRCSYLHYEDFSKLVVFKKGYVSTFVEDLIDYLTNGVISAGAFEEHLGNLRDIPGGEGFKGECMLDYIT